MSDAYASMAPQGGDQRNRITAGAHEHPAAAARAGRRRDAEPRRRHAAGSRSASLPQSQPAALGAAAPPMGAMGPVGGPMQPGLRLPGITPPGQLPLGMGPQQQQPGQQGVQQPY